MKTGDKISGFILKRIAPVREMRADIYEFLHERSGARLAYLDREDENMSFAVSFATPPEDDTGVCHIIEHSVLCGSDKYPLRDPFAELLKSSLNTFLNAMTYEDKTVYPVSSRCEKDFINLMSIYLDAVFHPKLLENPCIFRQEGWHYEYDGERLTRSGVVYNEMKGAYSSPDDIAMQELNRALFSDSVYGKDSGGDPAAIPSLTYEYLVEFYKKYYHPSNAKMFLDGSIDLDKVLSVIDSALCGFERRDINVVYEKSAPTVSERTVSYEISESEDDGSRVRALFGYVYSDCHDSTSQLISSVLCDYLCGTNASVLKRRLLDAELCRDVMMYTNRAREQTVIIEVRDTTEEKIAKIQSVIEECIRDTVEHGADKKALRATLDYLEFKMREKDYGSFPKGVGFALSALGAWLYGDTPESALRYEETLAAVRHGIDDGAFEQALTDMILENGHRATLIMLPDPELSERRAEGENAELCRVLEGMDKEELDRIVKESEELSRWQNTEESEEARASLPSLTIDDIPKKSAPTPREVCKLCDAEVIFHDVATEGITYTGLYFDASDVPCDELYILTLAAAALTNLDTDKNSALSLQNEIKASLGSFSASVNIATRNGCAVPYLKISASALDSKKDRLAELLREILLCSDFDNVRELENLIAQAKASHEDSVLSAGHSVALERAEAYTTSRGAAAEYATGHEAYLKIKELYADKDKIKKLCRALPSMMAKILTKKRLTLSLAGARDETLAEKIINLFDGGDIVKPLCIEPLGGRREFFCVPTKVSFAALASAIPQAREMSGVLRVVRSMLSYEYLWSTVRMGGGAYGTGFVARRSGFVGFYTYRDPSPMRSLGCFGDCAQYLREMAKSEHPMTKFIIGAIGELDILTTPRSAAAMSTWLYLNGFSDEDLLAERKSLLSVSHDDLLAAADLIDTVACDGYYCIVGGKDALKEFEEKVDNVLYL